MEMSFEQKLEKQIRHIISNWKDEDIYAISFLVTMNELSTYRGICNFPEFSIGYNTESDCDTAEPLSEDRWNFACWCQNNIELISAKHSDMSDELLNWYEEQGIVNLGFEPENEMYDDDFNYIRRGPHEYWELLTLISNIARRIQVDGLIEKHFGRIPIIVHDLDYSWYTSEMTRNANPNGEATLFLEYLSSLTDEDEWFISKKLNGFAALVCFNYTNAVF